MTDWTDLSAAASKASHKLVGWIFWDPPAIERFEALGVPNGMGYYIASRGAPLAPAGHEAVSAAFYSIHPGFIQMSIEHAEAHTTWDAVYEARNRAVGEGLRTHVPEICDDLGSMAGDAWEVADALPSAGRVLFGAHRGAMRSDDDPVVSAWLALNCIREWRGDTHWALLVAHDLSGIEAGLLHDAMLGYPEEWITRSRGGDDEAISEAFRHLEAKGWADGTDVNDAGVAIRDEIERRTDELTELPWRLWGEPGTQRFIDLMEGAGDRLVERIDETAGPNWMPAVRESRR